MCRAPTDEKSPSSAKYGPLRTSTVSTSLGHQEVQVGITLSVRMRAHVDRHVVDEDRQIGAVVEIVAAEEILVGFALAAVLRDDQPGHGFQYVRPAVSPGVRSVRHREW